MHNQAATYDIQAWIGTVPQPKPSLNLPINANVPRVFEQDLNLMTPPMDMAQPFFSQAQRQVADSFTRQSASPSSSSSPPTSRATIAKSSATASRRTPHSMVGRRYRDHLNRQIERLRVAIPEVNEGCTGTPEEKNDPSGRWPSKPLIIGAAVKYIENLQHEKAQDRQRIQMLQEQLMTMQNMLQCGDYPVMPYLQYNASHDDHHLVHTGLPNETDGMVHYLE